jgi:hypothetical protein
VATARLPVTVPRLEPVTSRQEIVTKGSDTVSRRPETVTEQSDLLTRDLATRLPVVGTRRPDMATEQRASAINQVDSAIELQTTLKGLPKIATSLLNVTPEQPADVTKTANANRLDETVKLTGVTNNLPEVAAAKEHMVATKLPDAHTGLLDVATRLPASASELADASNNIKDAVAPQLPAVVTGSSSFIATSAGGSGAFGSGGGEAVLEDDVTVDFLETLAQPTGEGMLYIIK